MNRKYDLLLLTAAAIAISGCALGASGDFSASTPIRPAVDAPDRFEPPVAFGRVQPADTIAGSTCLSPMSDPRDGTSIRIARSSTRLADYIVPSGRYGVGEKELLRVDCNTGQPLGIVRDNR